MGGAGAERKWEGGATPPSAKTAPACTKAAP